MAEQQGDNPSKGSDIDTEYSAVQVLIAPRKKKTRNIVENFSPHPNVFLFRHYGICHLGFNDVNSTWKYEQKTLSGKIENLKTDGKCWSNEYRVGILTQITHGLWHLHKHGIIHGYLKPRNIIFSTDKKAVIADYKCKLSEGAKSLGKSKIVDIHQLAKIFYFVLSNGDGVQYSKNNNYILNKLVCQDPLIANDLILKMLESVHGNKNYFSPEEILKHPFFWGYDKKVNFLVGSRECIDSQTYKAYLSRNKKLHIAWKIDLKLKGFEKKSLQPSLHIRDDELFNRSNITAQQMYQKRLPKYLQTNEEQDSTNSPATPDPQQRQIQSNTRSPATPDPQQRQIPSNTRSPATPDPQQRQIPSNTRSQATPAPQQRQIPRNTRSPATPDPQQRQKSSKKNEEKWYKNNQWDLIRFIRDVKIHLNDVPPCVLTHYFEDDDTKGYWLFFSRRYPHVLMNLYDFLSQSNTRHGFKKVYFESVQENLSTLPEEDIIAIRYAKQLFLKD